MQVDVLNIIYILAAFLGILLFVLLSFSFNRTHSSRILGFFILCLTLFTIHNVIFELGLMRELPWLLRFPKPLAYAVPVLVYLYVRSHVYNELNFRRRDWMLFLPVMLHAVELLPFYFMPIEDKKKYLESFSSNMNSGLQHTEGVLPPFVHPLLILSFGFVMYFLAARLLVRAQKDNSRFGELQNRQQLRWLQFFVSVNSILALLLLFHLLTRNTFHINTFRLNTIEAALMLICIGVALFFNPNILYGFRGAPLIVEPAEPGRGFNGSQEVELVSDEIQARSLVLSDARKKEFLEKIIGHFQANRPYINQRYNTRMLSEELGIPYPYLSQVINQEYGMNFNELINRYRVDYVKELLTQPDSHQYTFEALASQAGFSSRATFSRAFSRFEGCTPSVYLKSTGLLLK